jgi:DNA repair exonuclease SbcCD nuclease subunit
VLLPCPLLRRHEADDPTTWIRDLDFGEFGNQPRIVIAHGSITAFGPGGSSRHDDNGDAGRTGTNTIAIDRLPLKEIDYVALGDWHGFMAAGRKAWYSGTPEIDRFPKAGQEPGHVACVTVARGAAPTVATVRTGRFRWLGCEVALDATNDGHGPAHLDDVLTQVTVPQSSGEPGFEGCLADVRLTGTVSLAGRAEIDRVIESWQARLLRLDLTDDVRIAPTADEIHDLTERPDDPIITRVATELVHRLEAGEAGGDLEVVRQALHLLHGLAQTTTTSPDTLSTGAARK